METTMGKALEAYAALNSVRDKVKGKTALDLFHLKNMLKEAVDFQCEEEQKLVEQFGGVVTEAGMIIIADKEKRAEYTKERKKLAEMEYEVKTEPVRVDLEKAPDITMEDIEQLDGFVKFE